MREGEYTAQTPGTGKNAYAYEPTVQYAQLGSKIANPENEG